MPENSADEPSLRTRLNCVVLRSSRLGLGPLAIAGCLGLVVTSSSLEVAAQEQPAPPSAAVGAGSPPTGPAAAQAPAEAPPAPAPQVVEPPPVMPAPPIAPAPPTAPAPEDKVEEQPKAAAPEAAPRATLEKMGLLPVEFTAFGDFFYRFERPGQDDFHLGSMELDASLRLSTYVNVSTAIPYSGEERTFGVAAFVIDCGLAGEGEGYLLKSHVIQKSGISFGKFDVPIGIAYLQYPATANQLITQPQAVTLTHGQWNDLGAQGYAVGKNFTAVGFVVNGQQYPTGADELAPSRTAAGGRLSAKLEKLIDVGGSGAVTYAGKGAVMVYAGGDAVTNLGPLNLRGEYLVKRVKAEGVPELTHGIYAQGVLRVDPVFFVGRYDTALADATVLDRRVSGGGGVEVFPQGEVRAVYEHSFDTDIRALTLQLVGGSSFQPTGLRR